MSARSKNKSFEDVLTDEKRVVPLLVEREIREILVETILAYLDRTIRLELLLKVAASINTHKQASLSRTTANEIYEILSLNHVDELLTDAVQVLTDDSNRRKAQ